MPVPPIAPSSNGVAIEPLPALAGRLEVADELLLQSQGFERMNNWLNGRDRGSVAPRLHTVWQPPNPIAWVNLVDAAVGLLPIVTRSIHRIVVNLTQAEDDQQTSGCIPSQSAQG